MQTIADLIDRGIWVFPIRGRAASLEDAKAPLSFCIASGKVYECGELPGRGGCEERCRSIGGSYVTWKSQEILDISRIYASRGHRAWGIWLKRSGLIGIDIDLRKEPSASAYIDALDMLMCDAGAYVEATASGGRHYIFRVRADSNYSITSDARYIEYKYDGYFIVAPSILSDGVREYRYRAICGEIPPKALISDARRSVEEAFKRILNTRIRIVAQSIDSNVYRPHRPAAFPSLPALEARRIISSAGGDLLMAAAELFRSCGCHGMAAELERAAAGKPVRIRKVMIDAMRTQRTSRFVFLHLAATAMRILGVSEQDAYEAISRISFIDSTEDPVRDSPRNAVDNVYRYSTFRVMAYGMCPLCDLIGMDPCPVRDPYTLIIGKRKKI
ncbi:MAG: bifunctional DNA primase/polymerase [Sulfolobales archaeon]